MITLLVVVAVVLAAAILTYAWRPSRPRLHRLTPPSRRILFPFVGDTISQRALDAALRMSRAEGATLVPAYIATVPLQLNIEAPLAAECETAVPLLETIEMRAARVGVTVDSRIETGRTPRHALRRLVAHESFDRIVIPASESREGFSAVDIAWLLDNVPGEIVVIRPAGPEHLQPRRRPAAHRSAPVDQHRAAA
ncbi:MAG TPA: universal stress protein [Thermoleophilaceae bacterium]|nr:universal stress protein [Thermoleophilaceae bacterium]